MGDHFFGGLLRISDRWVSEHLIQFDAEIRRAYRLLNKLLLASSGYCNLTDSDDLRFILTNRKNSRQTF